MSATDALVELVRAALRDPAVRADILELVSSAAPVNDTATEPLLDAVEAAKILGMTAPAVRAAAYRETLPCVRVGRLLRFRRSELLAATRR
jgi:excisionase family DNA binding protein